jgi:hypothetical protein
LATEVDADTVPEFDGLQCADMFVGNAVVSRKSPADFSNFAAGVVIDEIVGREQFERIFQEHDRRLALKRIGEFDVAAGGIDN